MFHLFKRVYIETDDRLLDRYPRVLVSARRAQHIHPQDLHAQAVIHASTDLESFYQDHWLSLLEELYLRDDKVVIYADHKAYVGLITSWLRALFPTLPLTHYIHLMRNHFLHRYGVNMEDGGAFFQIPNVRYQKLYRKFTPLPALSAFIKRVWADVSLEYHTLQYLQTGTLEYIGRPAIMFAQRAFNNLIVEARRDLLIDFYNPRQQQLLGYEARALAAERDPLAGLPRLELINSSLFAKRTWMIDVLEPHHLPALERDLRLLFTEAVGLKASVVDNGLRALPLLVKDPQEVTNEDVALFFDITRAAAMNQSLFPTNDNENINSSLVQHFLSLDQAALESYELCVN